MARVGLQGCGCMARRAPLGLHEWHWRVCSVLSRSNLTMNVSFSAIGPACASRTIQARNGLPEKRSYASSGSCSAEKHSRAQGFVFVCVRERFVDTFVCVCLRSFAHSHPPTQPCSHTIIVHERSFVFVCSDPETKGVK
jgi:hypothetical protein